MPEFFDKFFHLFADCTIFLFCALAGSLLLAIQVLLNFFGVADLDDASNDSEVNDEMKFKLLSIQTIAGFLMMFGWTALACQKELNLSIMTSVFLSIITGTIAVIVLNVIFKIAKKLQSSGNTCKLDEIVGKEAYVYQRIPKNGVGKISISFQHLTCEIDAISLSENEIPSFARVQIITKKDDSTVIVKVI